MRLILIFTAMCTRVFVSDFENRFAFADPTDLLARRDGVLRAHDSWITRLLWILPFCERQVLMQADRATIGGVCFITGRRGAKRDDDIRRAVAYYVTEQAVLAAAHEEDVLLKENAP